jgi:ABC-type multidrug transport system fused ATPase/permease subunit
MNKKIAALSLIKKVASFAQPFRIPLRTVFICILSITFVEALNSLCLSRIFDIVQKHGTDNLYLGSALTFMIIALLLVFARIVIVGIQQRTEANKLDQLIANHLNKQSIAKFLSFSNGQHINEHSGVKQTIVNSGTTSIQNQINLWIFYLVPAVAQAFVGLGGIFYANSKIGLIFIVVATLFCYLMYRSNALSVPGVRKLRDRKQLNSRFISELYRFVSLVINESQSSRSLAELSILQEKQQSIYAETWLPAISRLQVVRSSTALLRYGALFLAVYFVFNKEMTIGSMFLVFTFSSMFMNSLWEMTNIHKQFLLDKINIEKYLDLMEVNSDIVIVENPVKLENIQGRVEFKDVSFYYPKRVISYEESEENSLQPEPILRKVSFIIEPGQKIGMVGESGSGKSTTMGLIKRNFDPQAGQITIDGHDLRILDLNSLLQKIGSVDQEVVLFDRSIRENILFGLNGKSKDVSEEKMHELGKIARIDAFFSRLEHGFDTLVGEKGVKLSGGERQRVGIARALAKNPSILIFDEATSSLDSMSERIVQQSIDEACKGKTSIIIAHRLSTVKNCDKIFVFRHGILLAQGTHEELLLECEYYADLVQHQMAV